MPKALYLFAFLSFFVAPLLAGKTPQQDDPQEETHSPPRLPSHSLVPVSSHVFYSPGKEFPQDMILAGVSSLPTIGLSDLPCDIFYVRDVHGILHVYGYTQEGQYRICVYGPNTQGYTNFVTEGGDVDESFCYANHHLTRYEYDPPITYPNILKEDRAHKYHKHNKCHKLGREHTIPQTHNSNSAVNNYYPGCECLNQGAENALIATGLGAYGKVLLYDAAAPTITQKIKYTPRNTGRAPTKIFNGMIYKSFYCGGGIKVHYFPHDKRNEEIHTCFYKSLKDLYGHYANILGFFEVRNVAHLFKPLIWDLRSPPKERLWMSYRSFFQGLNLIPNFSLNDAISFLRDLDLPFSWNGCRGYTQEEVQRIASMLHRRGSRASQQTPIARAPYSMVWNNFRLPALQSNTLVWEDARNNEIPLIPNNDYFPLSHRNFFLNYLWIRLVEDAAKYQTDSIGMKLGVSKIYLSNGKYQKAIRWFNMAYRQCFESSSLPDSLKLSRYYMNSWSNLPTTSIASETNNQYLNYLSQLLQHTKQNAFVEELVDLEKFNQEMTGRLLPIDTGIDRIKKISPQNSKLLKARALNAADVDHLVRAIEHTQDLEELSLENALFYVEPDECFRTFSIGRDGWNNERNDWEHISDDGDWEIEPISEKEYFWEEERPVTKILTVLQRHSHSLKKLSFAHVTFNGRAEGARILHELREMSFPHLGELSISREYY